MILLSFDTEEFDVPREHGVDFSLEEVGEAKWNLVDYTRDLHHEPRMNEGNVMTEYEKKFSEAGNAICKLIANR